MCAPPHKITETVCSVQKLIKNDLNIIDVDRFLVSVQAGSGGNGTARYNGVGGSGGDVYFVAKPGKAFTDIKRSLKQKMKVKATSGDASQKTALIGKPGGHVFLEVPLGVEVVDVAQNTLITRCTRAFQKYLIAKGGEGGNASNGYKGSRGEKLEVAIHLKLRPNVGLVGFPNAGKSTLLKAFIPEKSVKIAPYPFTTIKPQIGFWNAGEETVDVSGYLPGKCTLSIADMPGIIEGASKNRGRGYQFLKHLEYANVLLLVVDCTGFQLKNEVGEPKRTALESVALLNVELECYDRKLIKKPVILALNKTDLLKSPKDLHGLIELFKSDDWAQEVPEEMRPKFPLRFEDVTGISAMNGGIESLQKSLKSLYNYLNPLTVPDPDESAPSKKFI
ncbi:unnamed protein product [Caenorhabditis auriculariae]|uniref:OBG-type G domain-containing protein n=1 Tax=Caenorhabditis auriculariae TaxID=2777116 RepID=A0A8S1GW02_9PELO|nr:unnamed protein product [Caenorhabditis auriculariae]